MSGNDGPNGCVPGDPKVPATRSVAGQGRFGHPYAPAPASRLCALHRLASANSVCICAMFFASPVAHRCVSELPLDHPERMLDLGSDAPLDPLQLIG